MKKSGIRSAALSIAASALILTATQAQAVIIEIDDADGSAGQTVGVGVSLDTEGSLVAGTQNDIGFTAPLAIASRTAGTRMVPDCTVNPEINKGGTAFSYQPPNCTPGTDCTGIRGLVLALDNVDPIADGSVMYTCQVAIASGAAPDDYELTISGTGASDPEGVALDTTGTPGTVSVAGVAAGTIEIGSTQGLQGETADFDVSLNVAGENQIAGTQNDITFDSLAAIASRTAGTRMVPDCAVNPAINKGGTAFSFQPPSCTPGTDCTGIRALVLALDNVEPIPSGSVMYTCQVAISEDAVDDEEYPLTCSNAGASDPAGVALDVDCTDGTVTVSGGAGPTDTPDTGPTSTPTVTPPTGVPTNTPLRTATNTPAGAPVNDCDDGCAITAPAQDDNGFLVWLLPAAMLLWLRRRAR